jgi:hypothetical protein
MPGPEFYIPDTSGRRLVSSGIPFELYTLMKQPYSKHYEVKDEIVDIGTDLKALNAMGKRLQQRYSDVDGLNEKDEENVPYYANFIFDGGQRKFASAGRHHDAPEYHRCSGEIPANAH